MIKGRREVSIAKGSQYGRFLSITKLASLGSLVPSCFVYSLTTYLIKFSSGFFRLKKKLIIVVPVMPVSELAHILKLFLVYAD